MSETANIIEVDFARGQRLCLKDLTPRQKIDRNTLAFRNRKALEASSKHGTYEELALGVDAIIKLRHAIDSGLPVPLQELDEAKTILSKEHWKTAQAIAENCIRATANEP